MKIFKEKDGTYDAKKDAYDAMMVILYAMVISLFLAAAFPREAGADEIRLYTSHVEQRAFALSLKDAGSTWSGDIILEHNPANSPVANEVMESLINYAAWSWSSRTKKSITPSVETSSTGSSNSLKINFVWADVFEIEEITGNFFTLGVTRRWYYKESRETTGVIVYLNSTFFGSEDSDCARHTIVHELGHAIGISDHSYREHAVMFANQNHCRYALTSYDAQLARYGEDLCFVEVMADKGLYIPAIGGFSAWLRQEGTDENLTWNLAQLEPTSLACPNAAVDASLWLDLKDVRQYYEPWDITFGWEAVLRWTGLQTERDTWNLEWAR